MGLFGAKNQSDQRFALPSYKKRDCTEFRLPSLNEVAMMNFRALQMQLEQGQAPDYWVSRISESESFQPEGSAGAYAEQLADAALARTPNLGSITDNEKSAFLYFAKFGWLAGSYERMSGQARDGLCHPSTWNAMRVLCRVVSDEEGESHFRDTVMSAGYAQGRFPNLAVEGVFARWDG